MRIAVGVGLNRSMRASGNRQAPGFELLMVRKPGGTGWEPFMVRKANGTGWETLQVKENG